MKTACKNTRHGNILYMFGVSNLEVIHVLTISSSKCFTEVSHRLRICSLRPRQVHIYMLDPVAEVWSPAIDKSYGCEKCVTSNPVKVISCKQTVQHHGFTLRDKSYWLLGEACPFDHSQQTILSIFTGAIPPSRWLQPTMDIFRGCCESDRVRWVVTHQRRKMTTQ